MKNKRKYPDQSEDDKVKKKLVKLTKTAKPDRPIVKEIKEKVAAVVESKKNSNNIVDIIGHLELDEPGYTVTAAINGMKRIFTSALERREMIAKEDGDDIPLVEKYSVWLYGRYKEVLKRLCILLHHKKLAVASLALSTLMSMIKTSWLSEDKSAEEIKDWSQSEKDSFNTVVLSLCSNKHQDKNAFSKFQEYLLYVDVKYYFLKHLSKIISVAMNGGKVNSIFVENVISALELVSMEDVKMQEHDNWNTFLCKKLDSGESYFNFDLKDMKKYFSNCWILILKSKINTEQYKRVLTIIHDKVLPYLSQPLMMTDFLLSSYNVGGSISLLALSGVFTLISKHNLEYPDFYTKLYQLFTPELLHVKYMARFFHLADIFLSSTHLPAYVVAAFCKKLARLSLTAPSTSIPMAIRFIHNMIFRHPALVKLIDNPESDMLSDPFDNNETDPLKCNAIKSSLWEVQSLQTHVLPQVSSVAKDLVEKGLREKELDVSAVLETSWQEMFERETKKKVFTNVPINWEQPSGLKMAKDDVWSQLFEVA